MCEIVKVASAPALLEAWPALYRLRRSCDIAGDMQKGSLMSKYRVKLAGRLALLQLPIKAINHSISEEVEEIVEEILDAIQNKVCKASAAASSMRKCPCATCQCFS